MFIEHNGLKLKLLGDPHLGRRFHHNVPLHRRGEREALVWTRFEEEFRDLEGIDYHVNMGDIFDSPHVSFETILRAYRTYYLNVITNPDTVFVVLRGNHDAGRDLKETTAFDVFSELCSNTETPNVIVTDESTWWDHGLVFFPWRPDIAADEFVSLCSRGDAEIVFGHWDTDPRSDPHNLIPTAKLAELGVKRAYTGHVHLPQTFVRDGVEVIGTGSMLPYAHGEDATGEWYVTLSLDEARERKDDLQMKCVRIDLQEGEKLDFTIDCLQLQVRPATTVVDEGMPQVSLGEFSLEKIFNDVAQDVKLPPEIEKGLRYQWQKISTQSR